jgi:hypothetical protein
MSSSSLLAQAQSPSPLLTKIKGYMWRVIDYAIRLLRAVRDWFLSSSPKGKSQTGPESYMHQEYTAILEQLRMEVSGGGGGEQDGEELEERGGEREMARKDMTDAHYEADDEGDEEEIPTSSISRSRISPAAPSPVEHVMPRSTLKTSRESEVADTGLQDLQAKTSSDLELRRLHPLRRLDRASFATATNAASNVGTEATSMGGGGATALAPIPSRSLRSILREQEAWQQESAAAARQVSFEPSPSTSSTSDSGFEEEEAVLFLTGFSFDPHNQDHARYQRGNEEPETGYTFREQWGRKCKGWDDEQVWQEARSHEFNRQERHRQRGEEVGKARRRDSGDRMQDGGKRSGGGEKRERCVGKRSSVRGDRGVWNRMRRGAKTIGSSSVVKDVKRAYTSPVRDDDDAAKRVRWSDVVSGSGSGSGSSPTSGSGSDRNPDESRIPDQEVPDTAHAESVPASAPQIEEPAPVPAIASTSRPAPPAPTPVIASSSRDNPPAPVSEGVKSKDGPEVDEDGFTMVVSKKKRRRR